MALAVHAAGIPALTHRLEIELKAPAPVGQFVAIEARIEERGERRLTVSSTASSPDGDALARARGEFAIVG
jgi:acyl-CoA thioesterase FadM